MASCLIFCAGEFDRLIDPVQESDRIIAADGGLRHTRQLGLTPEWILGDFDSLGYTPEKAQAFPVEKDDTDTMLAIKQGLALGCDRFLLYGSLDGPRPDHTVANYQALQYLADRRAVGYLIGSTHIVTVVKNGTMHFPKEFSGVVSVFCMGADARGVTLKGLQYPLENGTLTAGFPLGVSNHFTGQPASVSVKAGSLLVIFQRPDSLGGIVYEKE